MRHGHGHARLLNVALGSGDADDLELTRPQLLPERLDPRRCLDALRTPLLEEVDGGDITVAGFTLEPVQAVEGGGRLAQGLPTSRSRRP